MPKQKKYEVMSKDELIQELKRLNPETHKNIKEKNLKPTNELSSIERDNLKNIFHNISDGVYIVSESFDIQYINPVLVKEFGPFKGQKCYEYFHDRQKKCTWCKNKEVFEGETVHWECEVVKHNKIYDLVDMPLKNSKGQTFKLEMIRDITDKKTAEDKLLKKTNELTERVKELNCLYNLSKLIEKKNSTIDEILEGVIGIIPPAWQYPEITYAKIVCGKKTFLSKNYKDTEWVQSADINAFNLKKGVIYVGYLKNKALENKNIFLKEEILLINEISERLGRMIEHKQTESDSAKNQFYLSKAQEIGDIGTWELDLTKNKLIWTEQTYINFGVPFGTPLTYEIFLNCVHPEDRDYVNREWTAAIDGKPYDIEHRIIKNSKVRWLREKADINFNKIGKPVSAIGFCQDISKHKFALEEKLKLETHLKDTQKTEAIATLAGGIAHQFNNALSGIVGNIDLLEMSLIDEDNEKYIDNMKLSSKKMIKLTSQLLAYARGGKYQEETISGNAFLRKTLPLIMHTIKPDIHIDTDIPNDIYSMKADLTQLQMALSAIMSNASEAIEEVGLIKIKCKNIIISKKTDSVQKNLKEGIYICIEIEDDGMGMDEEVCDRIFEPFFTTNFVGRGLGMAAAYGIVNNHCGTIIVDSKLGSGTKVRIYLPAFELADKEQKVQEIKILKKNETKTVLVIEDEEIVRDMIITQLETLGYQTFSANNGKDAISIIKKHGNSIDIAIIDVILPDMGGKIIYQSIIKIQPQLKTLICSGYSIDGPAKEVLNEGADGFIQKPFRLLELEEKLNALKY